MTLCIAARCADNVKKDNIVCCFDTRVETDIAGSEIGFKFRKVSNNWAVLLAGQISRAEELIGLYSTHLADKDLSEFSVPDELRMPVHQFKKALVNEYVQAMLGISYDDFLNSGHSSFPPALFENISSDIARLSIGCQLILVPLPSQPTKHLFTIDADCTLTLHNDFAAIGTGGSNAYSWLSYRKQKRYSGIEETIVHVCEAKKFAESAPGVGKETILVWLTDDMRMKMPTGNDSQIANLIWNKFGPRKVGKSKKDFKGLFDKGAEWKNVAVG